MIAGIFSKPHPFEDGAFCFWAGWFLRADVCFGRAAICWWVSHGVAKVNGCGRTTWLWIKEVFGFCGELWLISGCSWVDFGVDAGFAGDLGMITTIDLLQICGAIVVFCVAGAGYWLVVICRSALQRLDCAQDRGIVLRGHVVEPVMQVAGDSGTVSLITVKCQRVHYRPDRRRWLQSFGCDTQAVMQVRGLWA